MNDIIEVNEAGSIIAGQHARHIFGYHVVVASGRLLKRIRRNHEQERRPLKRTGRRYTHVLQQSRQKRKILRVEVHVTIGRHTVLTQFDAGQNRGRSPSKPGVTLKLGRGLNCPITGASEAVHIGRLRTL